MQVAAIVQARMGSRRFPGKTLHLVAGKPLLEYVLERLQQVKGLTEIIVATSTDARDEPIADHCVNHGLTCHRGPLDDVAGRFAQVIDKFELKAFARVSADSPMLDQHLLERGLEIFSRGEYEIVTNVLKRTFPPGQAVEILDARVFRETYCRMRDARDREHVTKFFYGNPADFRIHNFESVEKYGDVTFVVDTPQDMERFAHIVAKMKKNHWEYGLDELVRLGKSGTRGSEP